MTAARPNVLLITTDQQRGDCYGFEGRVVHTPHLDRLAAAGTRFSACITPSLVCQPARASILTGLSPLAHGVRDNGIDLPEPTARLGFAGRLRDSGYDTAFIGKAHFSTQTPFEGETGRPECRTSSGRFGSRWTGPYMGFDFVELLCFGHDLIRMLRPPSGLHYEHWFFADGHGDDKLELHRRRSPTRHRATVPFESELPPQWHHSSWIGDRAGDFIKSRPPGRPFCLWVSFPDPHYPFDCPLPWSRLHNPDSVDLPAHHLLDLDRRPWWHRAFVEGRSDLIREVRDYGLDLVTDPGQAGFLRRMTANYYGMISLVDHNVGRILAALEESGLASTTVVAATSDHGDFLGDHGMLLKGPCAYEGLLRVGLVCRGPGIGLGRVVDAPVSTIDLAPTFLDYAGVDPRRPLHGQSLRPLLEGSDQHREFAWQQWDMATLDGGPDWILRTVRTDRYKLTLELGSGAGEMYDLEDDPGEMDNLFDDPGHRDVRRALEDLVRCIPGETCRPSLPRIGLA